MMDEVRSHEKRQALLKKMILTETYKVVDERSFFDLGLSFGDRR